LRLGLFLSLLLVVYHVAVDVLDYDGDFGGYDFSLLSFGSILIAVIKLLVENNNKGSKTHWQ